MDSVGHGDGLETTEDGIAATNQSEESADDQHVPRGVVAEEFVDSKHRNHELGTREQNERQQYQDNQHHGDQ